jgi:hypothetical protein
MMNVFAVLLIAPTWTISAAADTDAAPEAWRADAPILTAGPAGSIDARAVKDPTVVRYDGRWHVFYTACGPESFGIGYVSASAWDQLGAAPRTLLSQLNGGVDGYAAAPQVFFFAPTETWHLVYQTRDSNYQPVYSTTKTLADPESWAPPKPLVDKFERAKWIDFWVICDAEKAYLFYTRNHRDVYVQTTALDDFPGGFGDARKVFAPVHEAMHIYKVSHSDEYHMLYEVRTSGGYRKFGLAVAPRLHGPWTDRTRDYATADKLVWPEGMAPWTDNVSHGEFLRSGVDQRLEYDPATARLLIQGRKGSEKDRAYHSLTWHLGLLAPAAPRR